jgi:hypothetical protein
MKHIPQVTLFIAIFSTLGCQSLRERDPVVEAVSTKPYPILASCLREFLDEYFDERAIIGASQRHSIETLVPESRYEVLPRQELAPYDVYSIQLELISPNKVEITGSAIPNGIYPRAVISAVSACK